MTFLLGVTYARANVMRGPKCEIHNFQTDFILMQSSWCMFNYTFERLSVGNLPMVVMVIHLNYNISYGTDARWIEIKLECLFKKQRWKLYLFMQIQSQSYTSYISLSIPALPLFVSKLHLIGLTRKVMFHGPKDICLTNKARKCFLFRQNSSKN